MSTSPAVQSIPGPEIVYPLVFLKRRRPKGWYIAGALVVFVYAFVPGSYGYAAWFWYQGRLLQGGIGVFTKIIAAYATLEILFSIYLTYLSHKIQRPSPPSTLSPAQCTALFTRVLQSGLSSSPEPLSSAIESRLGANTPQKGKGRRGYVFEEQEEAGTPEKEEGLGGRYNFRNVPRTPKKDLRIASYKSSLPASSRVSESPARGTPARSREASEKEKGRVSQLNREIGEEVEEMKHAEGTSSPNIQISKLEVDDPRAVDFREHLRTWFNHVPFSELTKSTILSWLAWTSFNLPLASCLPNEEHMSLLTRSLALLEARCGWTFPDTLEAGGIDPFVKTKVGRKGKPKIMRLTMDPVHTRLRPAFMYGISGGANWFLERVYYRRFGLRVYREGAMEYLLRIPDGWDSKHTSGKDDPIVFIHGLGFGLLQNHLVIVHILRTLSSHPILIPLQPHISMNIFSSRHLRPLTRTEFVGGIVGACKRWNFWSEEDAAGLEEVVSEQSEEEAGEEAVQKKRKAGVVLLSHSNGSVGHGWLIKDHPGIAKRNGFVDPVVFCLWEGDVCYNFCYRTPRTAIELLLYYFIASEVGIANTIQRHFEWAANSLFFEEIPNAKDDTKTAFFIGQKDVIIDADRVKKYLNRHGVKEGVQMDPEGGHGDGLMGESLDRLMEWLRSGKMM